MTDPLIPDLPQPWIFDGYRRVYTEGRPQALWQARALNLASVDIEEETGKETADYLGGMGATLEEARDALLDAMKLSKPEQ